MSSKDILVPNIGDFKDVEVIEVLVKPGDKIKKNDSLVTIESDKSSVEIPSPTDGQVKDLKVKIGDKVSEGSLLVTLESNDSQEVIEEKKENKEVKCAAINKSGNRCNNKIEPGSSYCTIHAKVEKRTDGKKAQCKKIKSNKERCKMQTSAKSGYCYYHD